MVTRPICEEQPELLPIASAVDSTQVAYCQSCGRPLTDELTEVLDRSGWNRAAAHAFARARQEGNRVALIILDLDRFKQVNDAYGHPAGDAVLRAVAAVLRGAVGEIGLVGRYGGYAGDEFLALLPGVSRDDAVRIAQRIRAEVRALAIPARVSRTRTVTITGRTVSIGVAAYTPAEVAILDLATLVLDADVALRDAKRHGRDCIRVAHS